jgi:hypothetical protein
MRKIELEILEAIRHKFNRQVGNTAVMVSDAGNIQVLLHGSPIVRIEDNEKKIFVSLAGFNTTVTRGRINLVMNKYGISRIVNKGNTPEIGGHPIETRGWYQVTRNGVEIEPLSD